MTTTTRTTTKSEAWPKKIRLGRITVSVYRRITPSGNLGYQVANYASGKRRLDSYPTEVKAVEAANRLARQLSERQVVAASLTNAEAADYAAAVQSLKPHDVALPAAAAVLAECLQTVKDLPNLLAAVKFYAARHKTVIRKPVSEVVAELLSVKEARRMSARYLADLRVRLARFADSFRKDACDVTTSDVQAWLDGLGLSPQSYVNFRRVAHLLFEFAVARGYAAENPVEKTEPQEVRGGEIEFFTVSEMRRLLAAADSQFLPCLAIGAFAGLRSAEIQRLKWSDIDSAQGHIVVSQGIAKTASRRIVPIRKNLAAWLAPFAKQTGLVWQGGDFSKAQTRTARAAGLKWKQNGLRHSCASYLFALVGDAGRTAGELGNSPSTLHRHYRELVTPAAAKQWYDIAPEGEAANIVPIAAAAA
jgi:integrase